MQLALDLATPAAPQAANDPVQICPYCGDEWFLDVLEYWPEAHAWMFDTCCEWAHEDACAHAAEDPKGFAEWFERMTGVQARRSYDDELNLKIDFGLTLAPITLQQAKDFVNEHHRHNPPPVGWRWGHAVYNGPTLVAIAMVGRPVARMIDGQTTVEVNRLCVNPDLDPELAWNACSMLYGAAAKEAKRRGYSRIITYTLESESGGTLVAAGWTPTHTTKGGSWDRKGRARTDKAPTCRKVRWERGLNKKAKREVVARALAA